MLDCFTDSNVTTAETEDVARSINEVVFGYLTIQFDNMFMYVYAYLQHSFYLPDMEKPNRRKGKNKKNKNNS